MDILLDSNGDLYISPKGDIELKNSVAQKIRIKLLWFVGEWRWNKDEGMPYRDNLLIKNPDTDYFEGVIREKIFEVSEVTEVRDVSVIYDRKTRTARIRFVAITDLETIKDEIIIGKIAQVSEKIPLLKVVESDSESISITATEGIEIIAYDDGNGNVTAKASGKAMLIASADGDSGVVLSLERR